MGPSNQRPLHGSSEDEREQTEEGILESLDWYRDIVENSEVVAIALDAQGRVGYASPALERMLGYSLEDVRGCPIMDLVHSEDVPAAKTVFQDVTDDVPRSIECRVSREDGTFCWVSLQVRLARGRGGAESGTRLVGTLSDISEQRNNEQHLHQMQKLEAIGNLAGGVAHDFNNILTVILGYGEILLDGLSEADPSYKCIKEIMDAAKRAASLTRQLLAFGRKQTRLPDVLDMNAVVRNIENMLRRLIGEDIDILTELADDLGKVVADPGQVEQIIMNLTVNARDAMPQGGRLTIETANVELDEDYAVHHTGARAGSHVMLAISDTGCGMDAVTKSRVFDPFFTTKKLGKGTGLGLSTVYGIVKQSGGNIWVYSEPGHGTIFKIYFPRTAAPATTMTQQVVPVERGEGELVMLVEDDRALRELIGKNLDALGFHTKVVSSATEALFAVEASGVRPDLLLTDVVMPGMSGVALLNRLRNTQPGLKVLYMSGYTDKTLAHHGVMESGMPFIEKPFTVGALAQKIREVWDTDPPAG